MSALRLTPGRRRTAVVLIAALAVLVVALIGSRSSGDTGPPSSSFSLSGDGLRAYHDLLTRVGLHVERLTALPADARVERFGTLIVLDPSLLRRRDLARLRAFVVSGGTLLAGGQGSDSWIPRLMAGPPAWSPAGPRTATGAAPVPETVGVTSVTSAGEGGWTQAGASLPALGTPPTGLLAVAAMGRGRLELLADASPLQNRLLDQSDNAALGLALAGPVPGRVAFVESMHGYGQARGLAALPTRWLWMLLGLAGAGLLLVAARIRRLSVPRPRPVPGLPPRLAYVQALAQALSRTEDSRAAAARAEARLRSSGITMQGRSS